MRNIFIVLIFISSSFAQDPEVSLLLIGSDRKDVKRFKYKKFSSEDFKSINGSIYFDSSKKTVIFINGLLTDVRNFITISFIEAYLTRKDEFNIMFVDWKSVMLNPLSFGERFKQIGMSATSILKTMQEGGLDITTTHIVAYSFGNWIAGVIGRNFQSPKFSRITLVDPASGGRFLSFTYKNARIKLNDASIASFVDVIKCDTTFLTDKEIFGHVNFFPNNGTQQPICREPYDDWTEGITFQSG
jgi:hypothetical protein